jgi:hypothetical protein
MMKKLGQILVALSTLQVFAAGDADLNYLGTFIQSKQRLESGLSGSYISSRDRRSQAAERYYNTISVPRLTADFTAQTDALSKYLREAADFRLTENISQLEDTSSNRCFKNFSYNVKDMATKFQEAQKKFADVEEYVSRALTIQRGQQMYVGNPQASLKDFGDALARAESLKRDLQNCCLSASGNDRKLCQEDPYLARVFKEERPSIKAGVARTYSNPLLDLDLSIEDMGYFVSTDNRFRQAMSTGDHALAEDTWASLGQECSKQRLEIENEALKKHRQSMQMQDLLKAAQCTAPSILAHYGSNALFQGSLVLGTLNLRTQTHQFGCPPDMLAAIADIRTADSLKLRQRYLTDQIIPPMALNNMNEVPVTRKTYIYKTQGGMISNLGFIPDVVTPEVEAAGRSVASIDTSTVQLPVSNSMRDQYTDGRRISSSRKAAGGGWRRPDQREAAVYTQQLRALASDIREGGQDQREDVRRFASASSDLRENLREVDEKLSSRGAGDLRDSRRRVAGNVRSKTERLARSRGVANGATTSAGDIGTLLDGIRGNSSPSPAPSSGGGGWDGSPSTGTSVVNQESPTGGANSTWDEATAEIKLSWLKIRQQQMDSLIETKNAKIDSLVKEINAAAASFGTVKATLISKFSAPVIEAKLAGKAPLDNLDTMKSVRAEARPVLQEYGALNAKIMDLKGQLAMEENSLNNFMMIRSAAGGQTLNSLPSLSPVNGLIPVQGAPQPANLPVNPAIQPNQGRISQILMDTFFLPMAWATPSMSEQLKFIDAFRQSLYAFHADLENFAESKRAEELQNKKDFYAAYNEFAVLSDYTQTMYELPHDTSVVAQQLALTFKVEASDLIEEFKTGKSPSKPSFEILKQIEKARADAVEAEKSLQNIMVLYTKSYPKNIEDNPEVWFAPAASLLLE